MVQSTFLSLENKVILAKAAGLLILALPSCGYLKETVNSGSSGASSLPLALGATPASAQAYAVQFRPILTVTAPAPATTTVEGQSVSLKAFSDSACTTAHTPALANASGTFVSGTAEFADVSWAAKGTVYLAISTTGFSSSCFGPFTVGNPTVYLAGQSSVGTGQQITKIKLDVDTNAISSVSQTEIDLSGGVLRGFSRSYREGFFLVGDGLGPNSKRGTSITNFATTATALTLTGTALGNVHQSCHLPNGNMLVGEYGLGGKFNEYTSTGTFVREVAVMDLTGASAYCFALSNTQVLFIEGDGGGNGRVVKKNLVSGVWQTATNGTFDGTTYQTANSSNLAMWSVGVYGDSIYIGAFSRAASGGLAAATKFVKCPLSDLTYTNCAEFGNAITPLNPTERLDAITQFPGTKDFLFVTAGKLHRFNTETGVATDIADLSSFISNHSLVRYIVIGGDE